MTDSQPSNATQFEASSSAFVPSTASSSPARTSVQRYNLFSLVSFIGTFLNPIVGIVFGHIALRQIAATREPGRGFAQAGLIIGYVALSSYFVFIVLYVIILAVTFASIMSGVPDVGYYS